LNVDQIPEEYKNKGYVYWHVKDFNFNEYEVITSEMIGEKIDEIKILVLELINQKK